MGIFNALFGSHSQREVKKVEKLADRIEALEEEYKALSDE